MVINSTMLYNLSQNTTANVTITTALKAIGRPTAIVIDSGVDANTKKFSATKEFLYQMMCLGAYFALIPFFKKGAFSFAKKMYKNEPVFQVFDNFTQFEKINQLKPNEKIKEIEKIISEKNLNFKINQILNEKSIPLTKGVLEMGKNACSIIGLAILVPIICTPILHPILEKMKQYQGKK